MRRHPLFAAALTIALAACGSGGSDGGSDAAPAVATAAGSGSSAATGAADADVTFAQSMIPHHEQAIEMSEMALDPKAAASAAVKDLATRIKGAQDPEITRLKAWLTKAGKPLQMDTSGGHDMSSMAGMMSAGDMDALGRKTGKDFDKTWLGMMIDHHQGAIEMAETQKAQGADTELTTLADAIIAAQRREIAEMTALGGA